MLHERVDDEVIVIHLDTGAYASLRGPGADAWDALCAGLDPDECGTLLARRYDVTDTEAAEAVDELTRELVSLGLVAERPQGLSVEEPRIEIPDIRLAWTQPAIQVYTDMQDFLRLDPIHDVTPAGWPDATDG